MLLNESQRARMRYFGLAVALAMLLGSGVTMAEVIHIPVGQQAPQNQDLPRPVRGMSTDTVLETYGLPTQKSGPVGDPPISKWIYPAYTVYFESDTVIHSVLTHTPQVPQTSDSQETSATP